MDWSAIQWGTVAEWVTGGVAAAALAVTSWQLVAENRARHRAEDRLREQEQERLHDLARLVSVEGRVEPDGGALDRAAVYRGVFRNDAPVAFYDFVATLTLRAKRGETHSASVPGGDLPARREARVRFDMDATVGQLIGAVGEVSAEFADQHGNRWRLQANGEVVRA